MSQIYGPEIAKDILAWARSIIQFSTMISRLATNEEEDFLVEFLHCVMKCNGLRPGDEIRGARVGKRLLIKWMRNARDTSIGGLEIDDIERLYHNLWRMNFLFHSRKGGDELFIELNADFVKSFADSNTLRVPQNFFGHNNNNNNHNVNVRPKSSDDNNRANTFNRLGGRIVAEWAERVIRASSMATRLPSIVEEGFLIETIRCIQKTNRAPPGQPLKPGVTVPRTKLINWMLQADETGVRNMSRSAAGDVLDRLIQMRFLGQFNDRSAGNLEVVEIHRDFIASVRDPALLATPLISAAIRDREETLLHSHNNNNNSHRRHAEHADQSDYETRRNVKIEAENIRRLLRSRFLEAILSAPSSSRLVEKEQRFIVLMMEIMTQSPQLYPGGTLNRRTIRRSKFFHAVAEMPEYFEFLQIEDERERVGMCDYLCRHEFLLETTDSSGHDRQLELHPNFIRDMQKQHLLIMPTPEELKRSDNNHNNQSLRSQSRSSFQYSSYENENDHDHDRRRERSRTPPYQNIQPQHHQQQQQHFTPTNHGNNNSCILFPPPLCVFQGREFHRPLTERLLFSPPPIIILVQQQQQPQQQSSYHYI